MVSLWDEANMATRQVGKLHTPTRTYMLFDGDTRLTTNCTPRPGSARYNIAFDRLPPSESFPHSGGEGGADYSHTIGIAEEEAKFTAIQGG